MALTRERNVADGLHRNQGARKRSPMKTKYERSHYTAHVATLLFTTNNH